MHTHKGPNETVEELHEQHTNERLLSLTHRLSLRLRQATADWAARGTACALA